MPRAVAVGAGGVWVTTAKPAPPAPKGAIKIGVFADCQGIWGFAYDDSLAGAELPLLERGGRLGVEPSDGVERRLGRWPPDPLYFGCDDDGGSSTAQTLAEARRLVEQVGVDILIGPLQHAGGAGAPGVRPDAPAHDLRRRRGRGAQPEPGAELLQVHTNGAQWMAGLGAYAYHTLGWRRR